MRQNLENDVPVSGGTVVILGYLDLGNTPKSVSYASSIITQTGTYTLFRTGAGIKYNGSILTAGSSLLGKLNVTLPAGFGIQSLMIDTTGLNVSLVVRTLAS